MTKKGRINYKIMFEKQAYQLSYFEGKRHIPLVHTVFNKDSLNLVYASAGGMKSMLMFDLALALAKGGEFLGYQCEKSRVLYLDAEMSDSDIGERLKFFKAGSPENLSYLKNGDISFNFMDTEQQDGFIEYLEDQNQPYEAVFFDNLRTMALFNNENDSSQFQIINQFLIRLRDKGLAVFLIHHANKGGEEYAGSSNIVTPFDTVIGLIDSGFKSMRKIIITKNRGSNIGLIELDNQLISPCASSNKMVLNATDYKTDAEISHALIRMLDDGLITKHTETQKALREQGLAFKNGMMTQEKFIAFLKDNAEIEHCYKDINALKKAYIKSKIFEDELFTH